MLIESNIKGHGLQFRTSESLFCPRHIDKGTLAMLSVTDFDNEGRVLDLGCGYGVVGIAAAMFVNSQEVFLTDIDNEAVNMSKYNAELNGVPNVNVVQSDGFRSLDATGFTLILSNPPYQSDFSVAKSFILKGFNRLALEGKFRMVTKRMLWYRNKFIATFGGVLVDEIDDYYVFTAIKKSKDYTNGLKSQHKKRSASPPRSRRKQK